MAKRQRQIRHSKGGILLGIVMVFAVVIFIKQVFPKQSVVKEEEMSVTQVFIRDMAPSAQVIAKDYDLYPSVMLAQAILESNSGQSVLSQPPHYNYFGIKGDYGGQSVSLETWEDDGQGNPYTIMADFRSYGSMENGLRDYALFLQKDHYANVRRSNTLTYHDATQALTGVYATDTSYGTKLDAIIDEYDLPQYD